MQRVVELLPNLQRNSVFFSCVSAEILAKSPKFEMRLHYVDLLQPPNIPKIKLDLEAFDTTCNRLHLSRKGIGLEGPSKIDWGGSWRAEQHETERKIRGDYIHRKIRMSHSHPFVLVKRIYRRWGGDKTT